MFQRGSESPQIKKACCEEEPDLYFGTVSGWDSRQNWKDDSKLKCHFLQKEIKWEFNPPAVSHMGGIWERQIQTVRMVLNVILKEQFVDDERLSTLFCEVESIVNG